VKRNTLALAALAASCLLSGCVTGRRSFDVGLEAGSLGAAAPANKGALLFGEVTDSRHFENKPGDPSTPSVHGDVNQLSADERSRFIGRQRNGFGHAMGDIVLPDGKTVKTKIVEIMGEGLRQRGYAVVAAGPALATVSVDVQDFWTWTTPGFFALSFEARIGCKVTVTGNGRTATFQVRGYALNHGQVAKDKNWQEAYEEAFADFLKDFDLQLKDNGF
jgi:uncharacterized lipoprotein YajG